MFTNSLLLNDFSLESSKNDPGFFNKLAQAFARVVGTGKNKTDKAFFNGEEVGEIIKLLGQRFNMRNIVFEEGGPAVLMPFLNPNHVDYDDFVRSIFADPQFDIDGDEEIKSVMNKLKVKVAVGSVDIENGWVEGIYVDLPVLFMYPRSMLERADVFSPEEKAAIMLHECGHVLNFYERMTQVVKANAIASTLLKTMDGRAPYEVKKTIFIESAKLSGASEQVYERALKNNDKDAVATLVIGQGVFQHGRRFENGQTGTYASTQAEQTADQFATRFGGGKHIVTGLDKIYVEYGEFNLGKAFSLLFTILMMIWITLCTFGLIWLVIVASMSAEEIYDDPYTRFARMRYELINQLRATSLPQNEIMEIIDQTDLIKKIQARYNENEHRSSVWLRVAGIFRKGLRDDLAMEYLEKDLEKLANNDLFVSSARMKTIGA